MRTPKLQGTPVKVFTGPGRSFCLVKERNTDLFSVSLDVDKRFPLSGESVTFRAAINHPRCVRFKWFKDGKEVPSEDGSTLTISKCYEGDSGVYKVVAMGDFGSVTSGNEKVSVLVMGTDVDEDVSDPNLTYIRGIENADSAVYIVHGRSEGDGEDQIEWMKSFGQVVAAHSRESASVGYFDWRKDSKVSLPMIGTLLSKARAVGDRVGSRIVSDLRNHASAGFKHVHLIGHSAGAMVIQSASELIRRDVKNCRIHCTFLDPFVGFDKIGVSIYGNSSDWADNYYVYDDDTKDFSSVYGRLTAADLQYAANWDITEIDPNVRRILRSHSVGDDSFRAISTHGYPYSFYTNSVLMKLPQCAANVGFVLSDEYGSWNDTKRPDVGNTASRLCAKDVAEPIVNEQSRAIGVSTGLNRIGQTRGVASIANNALSLFLRRNAKSPGLANADNNQVSSIVFGVDALSDIVGIRFRLKINPIEGDVPTLSLFVDNQTLYKSSSFDSSASGLQCSIPIPMDLRSSRLALEFVLSGSSDAICDVFVSDVELLYAPQVPYIYLNREPNGLGFELRVVGVGKGEFEIQRSEDFKNWVTETVFVSDSNGSQSVKIGVSSGRVLYRVAARE